MLLSSQYHEATEFNQVVKEVASGRQSGRLRIVTFDHAVDAGLYSAVRGTGDYTCHEEFDWISKIRTAYGVNAGRDLDCIPTGSPK